MHALVVDDSRAMRLLLGRFLTQFGFEVCEAPDGRAALEQLGRGTQPDLVLVDWNMPDMDGLTFVLSLRTRTGGAGPRVLMVTSEEGPAPRAAALAAGADDFLHKPCTRETLLEKLRGLGLLAGAAHG